MRALGKSMQWRGVLRKTALAFVLTTASARAEAPSGRFVLSTETAYDVVTKLTWQRSLPPPTTYAGAEAYCASLSPGFRLPTLKELFSIIDFRQTTGAVDPLVFPNVPNAHAWSSTPSENGKRALTLSPGVTTASLPLDTIGEAFCVK